MKTNNETNSCAFFVSNEQVESVEFIDFGGILAGIVVTILVVYLINELMDTPKWLIGLMGLFLLFFLSFQFTAIIGAGKVKGVVEDITGLSNTVSGKVDWNNIETTYPVLKPYLDKVGTKVDEVSDQKTSALSLINSIINGFMWRRAAWALGGVMICFVVAALPALTGNGRNRQGQRGASASTRHRTTQHTSRSHRPRRR